MPLISIVVACHNRPVDLLSCLASFKAQKWKDFEILVVHEPSPMRPDSKAVVDSLNDDRFRWFEHPTRHDDWGNTVKDYYGKHEAKGSVIGHANGDNYYTPVYLEWMSQSIRQGKADFAYCDYVNDHIGYLPVDVQRFPSGQLCGIDAGGWLCRAEIVKTTPWEPKNKSYSDAILADALTKRSRTVKVPHVLWIHN